jgi:hypothetical protein
VRRAVVACAALGLLSAAYVVAHCALIETGREVIVLRTEEPDGTWLETRLWIVDDGDVSWLHGDRGSHWIIGGFSDLERPLLPTIRRL